MGIKLVRPSLMLALGVAACALQASCKRPEIGSGLAESGGSAVSWRVAPSVASNQQVSIATSGTGSEQDGNHVYSAQLQASSATEGQIYNNNLVEKRFMALRAGDVEPGFTLLVTTRSNDLCYVNNVRLNGQAASVTCKGNNPSASASPSPDSDERRRDELQRACERLARARVDSSDLYYARYDDGRNRTSCTCLNGSTREVQYRDYFRVAVREFEDDCKRRYDDSEASLQANRRACAELATRYKNVRDRQTLCECGNLKLEYAYARYVDRVDLFRQDCSDDAEDSLGTDNDKLKVVRDVCRELGYRLVDDGASCACSGERSLGLAYWSTYGAEKFRDACRE